MTETDRVIAMWFAQRVFSAAKGREMLTLVFSVPSVNSLDCMLLQA